LKAPKFNTNSTYKEETIECGFTRKDRGIGVPGKKINGPNKNRGSPCLGSWDKKSAFLKAVLARGYPGGKDKGEDLSDAKKKKKTPSTGGRHINVVRPTTVRPT